MNVINYHPKSHIEAKNNLEDLLGKLVGTWICSMRCHRMPCMLSTLVGHNSGVALPAILSFEGIGGDTYHF